MTAAAPSPLGAALIDRAAIDAPHPLFSRLRAVGPLVRVGETGVHAVTTWAAIEEALHREDDFSANLTGALMRGPDGAPTVFEFPEGAVSANVIATADEPAHGVHRGLVQPRLSTGRIAAFEARLRAWTRSETLGWLDAGDSDFVPVAERVPAFALAEMLGLPEQDIDDFRKWSMIGGDILAGDLQMQRLVAVAEEASRMADYLEHHLEVAKRAPIDGADAPLLHALARGVTSGAIGQEEAVGISGVLFGAAGESTAALIGSTVRILAERPDLAEALRADPGLISRFVEEVVRLEPPFKFHYRVVQRACELAGTKLAAGDRLMLMWASANRDPDVFDDPDALRLDRRHPKAHMSFGRGPHFCVGATLARLEARVVIEELLAATRSVTLDGADAPVYAGSIFVRRLERLPLRTERAT